MGFIFGLVALLFFLPAANAANWFDLEVPDQAIGPSVEANLDSLRSVGGARTVAIRISYPESRRHVSGAGFRSVMTVVEIDCKTGAYRWKDLKFHADVRGQGQVIAQMIQQTSAQTQALNMIPPAVAETLHKSTCSNAVSALR